MTWTDINVIQPHDFGAQFYLENGKWKVTSSGGVSTDSDNILSVGADSKAKLTATDIKTKQKTYALSLDATTAKIKLTDSDGVITSIDTAVLQGSMDDVDISADNTAITFYDRENSRSTTVDFSTFLTSISKANSNAISLAGDGKSTPLTANLIVDPLSNNLLKVSVNGCKVDPADIVALLNSSTSVSLSSSANTMTVTVNGKTSNTTIVNSVNVAKNATSSTIDVSVNGVVKNVPAIRFLDSNGNVIGYGIA